MSPDARISQARNEVPQRLKAGSHEWALCGPEGPHYPIGSTLTVKPL